MPFVLDASVTLSWAFEDEANSLADAAWSRLTHDMDYAHAPWLWWIEVRNTLLLNERRKRITGSRTTTFLGLLSKLPLTLDPAPTEANILALAREHGLTVYDSCYLELALRLNLPLATLDKALAKAARSEGLQLVG